MRTICIRWCVYVSEAWQQKHRVHKQEGNWVGRVCGFHSACPLDNTSLCNQIVQQRYWPLTVTKACIAAMLLTVVLC